MLDEIYEEINKSSKYKYLNTFTKKRVVEDIYSLNRAKKQKELIKLVKKHLHLLYGAYTSPKFNKLVKHLLDKPNFISISQINQLLRLHTSTCERLNTYNTFYIDIFSSLSIKKPNFVELGCGLNPLAFEYFPKDSYYVGYDIDTRLIDLQNLIFEKLKIDNHIVFVGDIYQSISITADVLMLLKFVPLLYAENKAYITNFLKKSNFKYLVVSFSTKSIGGKTSNMYMNSKRIMCEICNSALIKELKYDNEVVYIYESS